MNQRLYLFALWCGPVFAVVLLLAFGLMGFIPPLTPSMSAAEISSFYAQYRTQIRVGAMLVMQFGVLGVMWSVAMAELLRRIHSQEDLQTSAIAANVQMVLGPVTFMVFVLAGLFWTVAAFRDERSVELVLLLNDLGWLCFLMPVFSGALQAIFIGLAVLSDPRKLPLMPRWSGYFNLWCAMVFLPGALATFFKTGPFAWSGLFDFWLPLVAFVSWVVVNAVLGGRAMVSLEPVQRPDSQGSSS